MKFLSPPVSNPHVNEVLVISEATETTRSAASFRPLIIYTAAVAVLIWLSKQRYNFSGVGETVKVIQYDFYTSDLKEAERIYNGLNDMGAKNVGAFSPPKQYKQHTTITGIFLDDGAIIDFKNKFDLKNTTYGFKEFSIDLTLAKTMRIV